MRISVVFAAVLITAAVAWLFITRKSHSPFDDYTIERAVDNQHVKTTTVSPDGKYIASVITDAKGMQSLWVHNVPTNSERPILEDPGIVYDELLFSPDGSYIYYTTPSPGENNSDDDEYRIPVLGGQPSRVFQSLGAPLTFIGNGRRVCLYREYPDAGTYKFLDASADGGDEHVLYTGKGTFPHIPTCSPDGSTAILEDDSGGLDSVRFATGLKQPFAPAAFGRFFYYMQWNSNGKGLFAITVQKSHYSGQLAYLTYPAGQVHPITNDLNNYSGISVTADAKTIATTQKDRNTRFISFSLANATQGPEHQFSSLEWFTWMDNNRILISAEDNTLKIGDLRNDETTALNVARDHFFLQPSLCGRNAIVAGGNTVDQKNPGIYKMQLDGSVATRLSTGIQDLWPQCTPDGKQLFYADDHDGEHTAIFHLPLDGSNTAQRIADGVYFQIARDGSFLAVHYYDKTSRIQFFSPETLQPTRSIAMPPDASHFFALSSDSRSLYYFTRKQTDTTVWQLSIDNPKPSLLVDLPGRTLRFMQASPDGSTLGLVVQRPTSQVILLHDAH
jgi:Tol biopolymer transport system component